MIECPKCKRKYGSKIEYCYCGYKLTGIRENIRQREEKEQSNSSCCLTKITFICPICNNERNVLIEYSSDAFACQKCKSIFCYDIGADDGVIIKVVKKEKVIPEKVRKAVTMLDIDINKLNKEELKRAYYNKISKYHPDKVDHMGLELQKLAEEKTKEIVLAFNEIMKWLEGTEI